MDTQSLNLMAQPCMHDLKKCCEKEGNKRGLHVAQVALDLEAASLWVLEYPHCHQMMTETHPKTTERVFLEISQVPLISLQQPTNSDTGAL